MPNFIPKFGYSESLQEDIQEMINSCSQKKAIAYLKKIKLYDKIYIKMTIDLQTQMVTVVERL